MNCIIKQQQYKYSDSKELGDQSNKENKSQESYLVVQWLGLQAFTPVAWVRSLVRELRSCKPHWCSKKKKKRKEKKSQKLLYNL